MKTVLFRQQRLSLQSKNPRFLSRVFCFDLTIGLQGKIDPESGMVLNLVEFDEWFERLAVKFQERLTDGEHGVRSKSWSKLRSSIRGELWELHQVISEIVLAEAPLPCFELDLVEVRGEHLGWRLGLGYYSKHYQVLEVPTTEWGWEVAKISWKVLRSAEGLALKSAEFEVEFLRDSAKFEERS